MQDNNADIERLRLLADKKAQEEYDERNTGAVALLGGLVFISVFIFEFVLMFSTSIEFSFLLSLLLPIMSGILVSVWFGKRIKANKHKDKNNPRNF